MGWHAKNSAPHHPVCIVSSSSSYVAPSHGSKRRDREGEREGGHKEPGRLPPMGRKQLRSCAGMMAEGEREGRKEGTMNMETDCIHSVSSLI